MLAILLPLVTLAAPLEIKVEAGVTEVILDCPSGQKRAAVSGGVARFDFNAKGCAVQLVYKAGSVDGTGVYSCKAGACALDEVPHRPFSDGPGVVNFLFVGDVTSTGIELACPNGWRERTRINDHVATFSNVPGDLQCQMYVKGPFTSKFNDVKWGSFRCTVEPPVANCVAASP